MNKKGFTLIEILIVIAIIGILMSVVLISLRPAQARARDARRISDLKQIQALLELYYNKNGNYPTSLSQLTGASGVTNRALPANNSTSNGTYDYGINNPTTPTDYVLGATMEVSGNNPQVTGTNVYNLNCNTEYCVQL